MSWQAILPLLTFGLGGGSNLAGSIINREQSRGDIDRQNEYNSPINQLARLREAGLPMAAGFQGGVNAGQQSGLPQTSGQGVKDQAGNLQNWITYSTQLQQLQILKAEERLKNAEVRRNEAEADWLLSGAGEDRAGTNLTRSLGARQSLEIASAKGAHLANKIQSYEADYRPTRLRLENIRSNAEIANMINNARLTEKQIHAAELNNRIQDVIANYQPKMSHQQFKKLLKENNLLDEIITGKEIENDIERIRYRVEEATEGAQVKSRTMDAMLKDLTYDRVKEEFTNYKQYMEFVDLVQKQINKTPWQQITDPVGTFKAMAAMAYTTVTGLSGQMGGNSILSFLK